MNDILMAQKYALFKRNAQLVENKKVKLCERIDKTWRIKKWKNRWDTSLLSFAFGKRDGKYMKFPFFLIEKIIEGLRKTRQFKQLSNLITWDMTCYFAKKKNDIINN